MSSICRTESRSTIEAGCWSPIEAMHGCRCSISPASSSINGRGPTSGDPMQRHLVTRFGRFGNYDGQFRLAHDIAVAKDGAVYVVDAWGQRLQKFVPR